MQRVDHTSNLPSATNSKPAVEATVNPGYFRRPSAALGIQGTVVTADWANDIQEELATVITTNGLSLTKGTTNQLFNAIESQIDGNVATETAARTSALSAHAALIASETILGHLEVATTGEVQNLANNARALTPGNLPDAYRYGLGSGSETNPAGFTSDSQFYSAFLQFPHTSGDRVTLQWGISARVSQNHVDANATAFACPWASANSFMFLTMLFNDDQDTRTTGTRLIGFPNFGIDLGEITATTFEHSISNEDYRAWWCAIGIAAPQ